MNQRGGVDLLYALLCILVGLVIFGLLFGLPNFGR